MGIPRVLEALQANDWAQVPEEEEEEEEDEFGEFSGGGTVGGEEKEEEEGAGVELDPASLDFGFDPADMVGLRRAIWGAGGEAGEEMGDEDVEKLEQMVRKLQAVRDTSAGLPEEQRKRMAARAVGEVMKEL